MFKHLSACTALLLAGTAVSSAAALVAPMTPQPHIILVSGGCGPAFHRDPFGVCVPNRRAIFGGPVAPVRLPPPCPRGYHRDPDPARPICYPNF